MKTALLSITAAAREAPERLAIITRDQQITFAQAAARARPIARGAVGLATPILATRSVETVLAVYAALEARQPLGMIHPQQAAATQDYERERLAACAVPDDTAFVIFTSGSTGMPRGVVLPRRTLAAAARAHAHHLPWRDDDRWLVTLPLAHSGGLAAVVRCLAARRPIVLVEEAGEAWPLAEALASSATTLTSLVPTQLTALLDDPAWRSPPALRAVLVGGAACPPSLRRRAAERGVPILVTYGMTETFGQVATALADGDAARAALAASDPDRDSDPDTAIGPALLGVTLIAGTRQHPARIEIRGDVCMTGYLGEPALPARHLITNDDGWLDERGHLHVAGRRDDIIITGGANVSPLAVEEELRKTPGVIDACVFALPDERWGQIVAAALVTDPAAFTLDEALAHWSNLPASQRPRAVHLLARLPQNATGKLDRRALAQLPAPPRLRYP